MKIKISKKEYKEILEKFAESLYMNPNLPFYSKIFPSWKFVKQPLKKELLRIAKPSVDELLRALMTTKPKGVMIKGMEMPDHCIGCPCCFPSGICNIERKRAFRLGRPSWCPLQEVK